MSFFFCDAVEILLVTANADQITRTSISSIQAAMTLGVLAKTGTLHKANKKCAL